MLQNAAENIPKISGRHAPIQTGGLMPSALAIPLNCITHLHQWYTLLVHCPGRLHQSHLVFQQNLHPLPVVPMHMHDSNVLQICVPHKLLVYLSLAPQTHRRENYVGAVYKSVFFQQAIVSYHIICMLNFNVQSVNLVKSCGTSKYHYLGVW